MYKIAHNENLHSPWYLRVKKIKGKGRGIITYKEINKGVIICKCPVIPLNLKDSIVNSTLTLQYYMFDYPNDCEFGERCGGIVLGLGSLINHSDRPNSKWTIRKRNKEVVFWATRDIKNGEEITFNYNWTSEMWNGIRVKNS